MIEFLSSRGLRWAMFGFCVGVFMHRPLGWMSIGDALLATLLLVSLLGEMPRKRARK